MSETSPTKYPKSYVLMAGLTAAGFIASGFVQEQTWMFVIGGVAAIVAGVLSILSMRPTRP